MKLTMILTAACLVLSACGSGDSSDSGNSATAESMQVPTGVYAASYMSGGMRYAWIANFTDGQYELREYQIPSGMVPTEYKFTSQVSSKEGVGEVDFNFITTYSTCNKIGGKAVPANGEFVAMDDDGTSIYVSLPMIGGVDLTLAPTAGTIDHVENEMGLSSATENTNCN